MLGLLLLQMLAFRKKKCATVIYRMGSEPAQEVTISPNSTLKTYTSCNYLQIELLLCHVAEQTQWFSRNQTSGKTTISQILILCFRAS